MKYRLITGLIITIILIVAYVLLAPRQSTEDSGDGTQTEVIQ